MEAGPGLAERIRAASSAPHLAGLVGQVREAARRAAARGLPPPPGWSLYRLYEETGERRRYERAYFNRRGRLVALAAAALLDPDITGRALASALWTVCDEWTWALPAHAGLVERPGRQMPECVDLFAAETAHTLAEVLALLGDRLPGLVAERVRAEVHRRVLGPFFGRQRKWRWETAPHNWSAVCAGAAGMAALALWPDGPRLDRAIARCLSAMDSYLSGLGADGGCAEGVDYWVYGFGYFTYFAEALRARTGRDLLQESPIAAAAAGFPAAVQLSPGLFASFSDASQSPVLPTGLLSRLAGRLDAPVPAVAGVPDFDADPCYRWAHLSRTLAWTDPAVLAGRPPRGGAWLPELAWLVDRRRVGGLPVAFAAKGGHNGEPHNHLDLGHFILAAGAEQLLADLGAGEYHRGYFGSKRYRSLHPSAEAHSVPVIDGRAQRPGSDAAAEVRGVAHHPRGADLLLDLSAAYSESVQLRRSFRWRAGSLTLVDSFAGATDVDELFISRINPDVSDGTVTWRGAGGAARLRFDPDRWRPAVERIATRNHDAAPETVYRLRLRSVGPPTTATFRFSISAG